MIDLIYDNAAAPAIMEKFPHAKIDDASDFIHEDRIQVTLPDEDREAYFKHSIRDGYCEVSLGFQSLLRDENGIKEIQKWLADLKAERASAGGNTGTTGATPSPGTPAAPSASAPGSPAAP